jgi:nitroreductase
MPTLTSGELLTQLNWRYATKEFDPSRKIDEATIQALEDSLVLTPSSFGLQPWKFIIVQDQKVKEALTPLSWNQPQTRDCSHFVVFAYNELFDLDEVDRYLNTTVKARGGEVSDHDGLKGMMVDFIQRSIEGGTIDDWCKDQVYIAIGQLMASAAVLGIDACPMEGIQPAGMDELLGLKDSGFKTVVACALGYRAESDKYATLPKVRYPRDEIIIRI